MQKSSNAVEQIMARHGKPILLCEENDEYVKGKGLKSISVPRTVDCLQGLIASN